MISISPGHYGPKTGAHGLIDEVTEAIKVAKEVTKILRAAGIQMNYIEDNVNKSQSTNIGWLIAQHNKSSRLIDVSIHFNASVGTHSRGIGTETLVYSDKNKAIAQKITDAIANASGLKNRGAKIRTDLGLLKGTNKPCYLIEVCFVNDSVDVALYRKHFDAICQAIAGELAKAVGKSLKPSTTTTVEDKKEDESMLTETGRIAIRDLIKKARDKGLVSKTVHTDAEIAKYTDKQLLSYQAAIINITFK